MVVLDLAVPLKNRVARVAPWFGPAFVAAIAYADPGNFATNFTAGATSGYLLVWVIVAANLMAMLVQSLSAKLGLVTGRDLPELCRAHLPRPVSRGLWVQAELVAMATDLAEIVGGALALNLLFGMPLPLGGLVTCVVAFALLELHRRGYRRFETVIGALLGVILIGFLYTALRSGADAQAFATGLVPSFAGSDSLLLATGILGATVMPHVIYLHSALTKSRASAAADPGRRREALRYQRADTLVALGAAGLVNLAMLVIAAQLFFGSGIDGTDTLEGIHHGLAAVLDGHAALAFGIALLASGLASSGVGTYAGQVVMQGFIGRAIPLLARRLITMAPAMAVLALGVDPTGALVWSQVVLSFGVPFALVPLIWLTGRRRVLGDQVNHPATTACAGAVALLIIGLNGFLLVRTLG
ncbi:Nramp family divalent metal transporter [Actinoplanes teichomyceticus]|uniref:Divalent metal cation transporter MntH n=1 Tax=Actinoplanes teichomyceticus TaxID=1867 RepID=A0A561VIE7_ACTTI|nr:Nramp family divalent metal transporter [Actinoplanes teichomyceticus]TWG11385.1 manganese transport protein [Actinoplanes teichomyceticus]GIF15801.1 divalent metal cation transporter MntH [Actinoplanes teichomyceticus]